MFTAIGAEVPNHLDGTGFKVTKVERGGGLADADTDSNVDGGTGSRKCAC